MKHELAIYILEKQLREVENLLIESRNWKAANDPFHAKRQSQYIKGYEKQAADLKESIQTLKSDTP